MNRQINSNLICICASNTAPFHAQPNNTILLNASTSAIAPPAQSCTCIRQIRNNTGNTNVLGYDTSTREVSYRAKSFIIDHPIDKNKYLVHGCLEGPEGGVYYRGEGEITNGVSIQIQLPEYVKKLATDFTIQIRPIYCGKKIEQLYTSRMNGNSFTVYGGNCCFYWLVHGKRCNIDVEPDKNNVNVKGSGPYKWI